MPSVVSAALCPLRGLGVFLGCLRPYVAVSLWGVCICPMIFVLVLIMMILMGLVYSVPAQHDWLASFDIVHPM